ncbi:DUF3977 family protein [Bacillus pakistanensis]
MVIIDSKEGLKRMKKNCKKFKFIFGIIGN